MRNQHTFLTGAAALLLALAASSAIAQQPAPADPNQRAEQRVEAEQRAQELARQTEELARQKAEADRRYRELAQEEREQRTEQQRERQELERELGAARRELQKAAGDVARLSGEFAAPFVDGITRGFRFAGQRSMLGVGIEDTERGVRIASVSPNGPAAQAGIKVGDTITAIDGAALTDTRVAGGGKQSPSELLLAQMANVDAGEAVKLRVLNESGAERDVSVTAREISPFVFLQPQSPLPSLAPKGPNNTYSYSYRGPGNWFFRSNPWSEIQLVTLTPTLGKYFGADKGLLVVRGPEDGALGLRDGDVILDVSGREPTTPEHAMRILGSFAAGEPMKITIMREQRRQTLDVKIPTAVDY